MQFFHILSLATIAAAAVSVDPAAFMSQLRAIGTEAVSNPLVFNAIHVAEDGAITKAIVKDVPHGKIQVKIGELDRLIPAEDLALIQQGVLSRKDAKFLGIKHAPSKGVFAELTPSKGKMPTWGKVLIGTGIVGGTGAIGAAVVANHNKHQ